MTYKDACCKESSVWFTVKDMSFKSFKSEVKKQFAEFMTYLSVEEVGHYFESKEANREIEQAYNRDKKALDEGRITRRVFEEGCTSAVCSCLTYMYE